MATDEDETLLLLKRGVMLAQKHGNNIYEDANSSKEALIATAIIFSSLGSASGCSLHDLMGLLMETHKQTLKMKDEI